MECAGALALSTGCYRFNFKPPTSKSAAVRNSSLL